jgi:hypothetical protein
MRKKGSKFTRVFQQRNEISNHLFSKEINKYFKIIVRNKKRTIIIES